MEFERFFSNENVALYRLLASSTDVDQRRAILRLLAAETAKLKSELRQDQLGAAVQKQDWRSSALKY